MGSTGSREIRSDPPVPAAPAGAQRCCECTILIGPGYHESEPYVSPYRDGAVCWQCLESLERQAQRRARRGHGIIWSDQLAQPAGPVRGPRASIRPPIEALH